MFVGVFLSYNSITAWLGFASFILWLLLPKIKWGGTMKKRLETMSWPSRLLFLLMGLTISIILTAHSMYMDKTEQIAALQEAHSTPSLTIKPVTKQEIRTLLESINPEILRCIDKRQKQLHVMMSIPTQMNLLALSKGQGFEKYISIEKSGSKCIGGQPEDGLIKEAEESGYMDGYYIYPK